MLKLLLPDISSKPDFCVVFWMLKIFKGRNELLKKWFSPGFALERCTKMSSSRAKRNDRVVT